MVTVQLYQFLKRQYYWKGLKGSVQGLLGTVCNIKYNLKNSKLCALLFRNTSGSDGFYCNGFDRSIQEDN